MSDVLAASIDAARGARERLRGRPVRTTAAALADAGRRFRDDAALARALPEVTRLTPAMIRAVLPLIAEPLDEDAMCALHERESTAGTPPALVAAVVASNVPGLAIPAIAHGCLAGAAVVVKTGRADTLSAGMFVRALAAVDPALAATVVATDWRGGVPEIEAVAFRHADVVVATGSDATVEALVDRHGAKLVPYGDRTSFAVLAPDAADDELAALAWDVARYEQRGCLSPHAVLVADGALRVGERLLAALDGVARAVPEAALDAAERAAHRLALEDARFAGATVLESAGGTVIVDPEPRLAGAIGRRTVRIHQTTGVLDAFAAGTVECIGLGHGVVVDAEALRVRGVSRLCRVGRMQRPRIDWPRGQRPALASLFRVASDPRIQVES